MIFDGNNYRLCRTVIPLPQGMWHGHHKNYVMFGKIVPHNTPGAVKTTHVWRGYLPHKMWGGDNLPPPDGQDPNGVIDGKMHMDDFWYVYVLPIKSKGHSLTNLMYAPNGSAYLMYDGLVYVSGRQKEEDMITHDQIEDIRAVGLKGSAIQKARSYDAHVQMLLDEVADLRQKLEAVSANPDKMSTLEAAAKVDPDHLQQLLLLEKAIWNSGYHFGPRA